MSIFFSLPGTKKPTDRLSGDQNGNVAPSVPSSGWAVSAESGRTHSSLLPESSPALKTSRVPSGERTAPPVAPLKTNCVFSGGRMKERTVRGRTDAARSQATANPTASTRPSAAPTHGTKVRRGVGAGTAGAGAGSAAWTAEGRIPSSSSNLASPMSRNRRFGSFSRQRWSAWRVRGVTEDGSAAQSGSRVTTAAMTSVTVSPPNVLSPVSIS